MTQAIRLHTELAEQAEGTGVQVLLMHARFPLGERAEQSDNLEYSYGKYSHTIRDGCERSPRPLRSIVVTTQVVEASLDVDFDVVISELAPVSALLQRAGRGHRHLEQHRCRDRDDNPYGETVPTRRPPSFAIAHLHVLVPIDSEVKPHKEPIQGACGALHPLDERPYQQDLLNRTYQALTTHFDGKTAGAISVPEDVQHLVDTVDGDRLSDASFTALLDQMKANARNAVMTNAAGAVSIPSVRAITDLASLTSPVDADDALAGFSAASIRVLDRPSARYNINTITMLPVWGDATDGLFLDPARTEPLPMTGEGARNTDGTRRFSTAQIKRIVRRTISVPAWNGLRGAMQKGSCQTRPALWANNSTLAEIQVAVFDVIPSSSPVVLLVSEHLTGNVLMTLSKEQGLDMSTAPKERR